MVIKSMDGDRPQSSDTIHPYHRVEIRRRPFSIVFLSIFLTLLLHPVHAQIGNNNGGVVSSGSNTGGYGGGSIVSRAGYHALPPRALITTLTIVFSVFGVVLLAACATLFVHFFVLDLSDYILCCFQKQHNDRAGFTSGISCLRFRRCMLPSWGRYRQEPLAMARATNRHVYRPHLVAAASSSPTTPGLPACLNFRRRTDIPSFLLDDETAIDYAADGVNYRRGGIGSQQQQQQQQVFSISSSQLVNAAANHHRQVSPMTARALLQQRRSAYLSSFYANSVFLPDDSSSGVLVAAAAAVDGNAIATLQLPQPPSYDEAVRVTSFTRSNQLLHQQQPSSSNRHSLPTAAVANSEAIGLSLFSWSCLPPPPAYDEVVRVPIVAGNNVPLSPAVETGPASTSSLPASATRDSQQQQQQQHQHLRPNAVPQSTSQREVFCSTSNNRSSSPTQNVLSTSSSYGFPNPTYLARNSRISSVPDHKPCRSQRLSHASQHLLAANGSHNDQAGQNIPTTGGLETDSSNPTIYDVTHVYSWHI